MAASELFRAARQLLSDCEDGCESVQLITLTEDTDRHAIFASLPECVRRACDGGTAAGQVGAIWPARCCAGTFHFLFGFESTRKQGPAYHFSKHFPTRKKKHGPTPSPLAHHSALILLQLTGAGSDLEMDRRMQIDEHDPDELVCRKIACAGILTAKSPLKTHRELAARLLLASWREVGPFAGAIARPADLSSGYAVDALGGVESSAAAAATRSDGSRSHGVGSVPAVDFVACRPCVGEEDLTSGMTEDSRCGDLLFTLLRDRCSVWYLGTVGCSRVCAALLRPEAEAPSGTHHLNDGTGVVFFSQSRVSLAPYNTPGEMTAIERQCLIVDLRTYARSIFERHSNVNMVVPHWKDGRWYILVGVWIKGVIPIGEPMIERSYGGVPIKVTQNTEPN